MRYALVKDGYVLNVIEWDGVSQFFPMGAEVIPSETASPGWTYVDGVFVAPPEPPIISAIAEPEAKK